MRIGTAQRQSILRATRQSFGEDAKVWLFGSVLAFMEKIDVLESAERWK
jgi:hypothetical protein